MPGPRVSWRDPWHRPNYLPTYSIDKRPRTSHSSLASYFILLRDSTPSNRRHSSKRSQRYKPLAQSAVYPTLVGSVGSRHAPLLVNFPAHCSCQPSPTKPRPGASCVVGGWKKESLGARLALVSATWDCVARANQRLDQEIGRFLGLVMEDQRRRLCESTGSL